MPETMKEHFSHMSKQASIIPSVAFGDCPIWGRLTIRRPVAAGIPSLPFQALWASFPEGKPTHVRFEAHGGLTDETYSGQMTLSVRKSPLREGGSPKRWGNEPVEKFPSRSGEKNYLVENPLLTGLQKAGEKVDIIADTDRDA